MRAPPPKARGADRPVPAPVDAYGQVFVEIDAPFQRTRLPLRTPRARCAVRDVDPCSLHNGRMPDDLRDLLTALGARPLDLLAVVLAAIGIYVAFLLLVRLFGPRSLHGMSTFDAILVIMFGSVAARAILGYTPTLAGGIVGLTTLFVLEAAFGQIRATARGTRLLNARPVLVLAGGVPLASAMRRTHLTETELHTALRSAGVRALAEVACAIFEPNGRLSIIRYGELIDPALLDDVIGREHVPVELLRPSV